MATYRYDEDLDRPHIITISRLRNEHFDTIQRSLAHEIVHMSFWKTNGWDKHGKAFKTRTRQVAREFGWDSLELWAVFDTYKAQFVSRIYIFVNYKKHKGS